MSSSKILLLDEYDKRVTRNLDIQGLAVYLATHEKFGTVVDTHWDSWFLGKYFSISNRGLSAIKRNLLDSIREVTPITTVREGRPFTLTKFERQVESLKVLLNTNFEKARVMTRGYVELGDLLGRKIGSFHDYQRQIGFYFGLAATDELEDFLKYQTASACALVLGNECDQRPECVRRGGWSLGDFCPYLSDLRCWIRKSIRDRRPTNVRDIFSFYTVKRIAPAMSETKVSASLEKNEKALGSRRADFDKSRLIREVERTVDELFKYPTRHAFDVPRNSAEARNFEIRRKKNLGSFFNPKVPSLSACYEQTKGRGGNLGYLLDYFNLNRIVGERVLLGFVIRPDKFCKPVELYGWNDEEEYNEMVNPSRSLIRDGPINVRREPILEPFKVRIISKGEALPYQVAHGYQKFLWRLIQRCDAFDLTGRPCSVTDVEGILRWAKETRILCSLVSGDYSAATDNLDPDLGMAALNRVIHNAGGTIDAELLIRCLVDHNINKSLDDEWRHDKKIGQSLPKGEDDNRFFRQRWGQLMGSPISFPILCIVNAAVTRSVMERSFRRRITLSEGALKVNGDDILFALPENCYQDWTQTVTSAGLSPSIGKNYVSRRYAVINSQLFDCGWLWDHPKVDLKPTFVPLVKMNLVYCQQHETTERRKGEDLLIGDALRHGKTLEGRMKELVNGFDGDMREKLLSSAYHYAKPSLELLPRVDWCLPKALGGLGLPMPKNHVVSDLHKKIATMILCLDEKSRRDIVRLSWMREPGKVFCGEALEAAQEVNRLLGNRLVLTTSDVRDPLTGPLLRSFVCLGIDDEVSDSKFALRKWDSMYKRWVKRAKNVRWLEDGRETGLNIASIETLMKESDSFWGFDHEVVIQ